MNRSGAIASKVDSPIVGMGQVLMGRAPDQFGAILGSCIGLSLYHQRTRTAVFAHVVLPTSSGRSGQPGKFADIAIPHMLKMMAGEGISVPSLVAKITGGAAMFGGATGPLKIGDVNAEAVLKELEAAGVRVVAQHIGGTKGRRINFDCQTGDLHVQIASRESVTI